MTPAAALSWAVCLLCWILFISSVEAAVLPKFIDVADATAVFPGADRLLRDPARPTIADAYAGDTLLGHVFVNSDFVSSIGYSGKPIDVLLGLDTDGVLRQARLVAHSEPIVLIGIPEQRITRVIDQYIGRDIVALARKQTASVQVDIVSGATVTIMVIDDTILRASILVARQLGLGGLQPKSTRVGDRFVIDEDRASQLTDWIGLVGDGSIRRLKLTLADINQRFAALDDPEAGQRPERGEPDATFIELYTGLVSIPSIGISALGENEYRNLRQVLQADQHAIAIAGLGRYSFKGSGYVRGGIFDRFHLQQGDLTIRFHDYQHKRLRRIEAQGAPEFKEVDLFRIPPDVGFDPSKPWTLRLLVGRETGPTSKAFLTFDLDYRLPEKFLKRIEVPAAPAAVETDAEAAPLWQKMWRNKPWQIGILLAALAVLSAIFYFQDWLARRPVLTDRVRIGFLLFTLFWLGFYANAQLSVVNVMAVFNALVTGFSWDYFLMEPLIFILWGGVAAALLFWGRGVFCGWLCPFGALQELLNKLAKRLGVRQYRLPWVLHERLWTLKYILFLVLFGVSLHSLALAEKLAEVEPFKTAIILKFVREWPFVLFALAALAVGLFIERFYCRYLCPLGAALAIPGRMRMFPWLKRYAQCGTPCQRCRNECMVESIHPEGQINPNECLYCLHCQTVYHDDQRCPVLVQKRLKRERRQIVSQKVDFQGKVATADAVDG